MKEWFKKEFCNDVKVNRPFYMLMLDCLEVSITMSIFISIFVFYVYTQKLDFVIRILEVLKENSFSPWRLVSIVFPLIFVVCFMTTVPVILNLSYEQEKREKLKKKKKAKE